MRLLIVADDPLARSGLAALLADRPELPIVGQVGNDEQLLSNLELFRPELLLLDLGWDGDELSLELNDLGVPTIALLPPAGLVAEAWAAGARAILPRQATASQIEAAAQAIGQGLTVLDERLREGLRPAGVPAGELPPSESLTPREREVLQLVAEGLANRAIAQRLVISEHTVKFHINAIMTKLAAQSRTEAVVRATRLGLLLL